MRMNSLCAVNATGTNASQRSQVGAGMNRISRGRYVKRFEWRDGLDNGLNHENTPLHIQSGNNHGCQVANISGVLCDRRISLRVKRKVGYTRRL